MFKDSYAEYKVIGNTAMEIINAEHFIFSFLKRNDETIIIGACGDNFFFFQKTLHAYLVKIV